MNSNYDFNFMGKQATFNYSKQRKFSNVHDELMFHHWLHTAASK